MAKFDSEEFYKRLYKFGLNCQKLTLKLPRNIHNREYSSQLVRASASVGANYIEAQESFSLKDFIHRLKISRKEVKESAHWLNLLKDTNDISLNNLIYEAEEIKKMLSSSIINSEKRLKK